MFVKLLFEYMLILKFSFLRDDFIFLLFICDEGSGVKLM